MDEVLAILVSRINWWVYILLMMIGLYGITIKKNLMNIKMKCVCCYGCDLKTKQSGAYL